MARKQRTRGTRADKTERAIRHRVKGKMADRKCKMVVKGQEGRNKHMKLEGKKASRQKSRRQRENRKRKRAR